MKTYSFIVNRIAGNGRAANIMAAFREELARRGAVYDVRYTSCTGDAVELARNAAGEVIVSVGGDGTINEIANGLPAGKILGIIPAGSGNDLIKSLRIPKKPKEAFFCLLQDNVIEMDVGTVECGLKGGSVAQGRGPARIFTNGVGVGFDASVAIRKGEISFLKGTAVYVLAVLETLRTFDAPTFTVTTNGHLSITKQLLLAAIGNGKCAGGGFYLTPEANPSDGLFDVTLIDDVPIRTILHLMPRVMRGKHMGHPSVGSLRTNHIEMESATPFNVHADGEIVGRAIHRVEVKMLPKGLKVIAGH